MRASPNHEAAGHCVDERCREAGSDGAALHKVIVRVDPPPALMVAGVKALPTAGKTAAGR